MMDFGALGIEEDRVVDDALVKRVESKIGAPLPSEYLELIKFSQEPEPTVSVFEYDGGETCVSEFFRFTDEPEAEYGLLQYLPKLVGYRDDLTAVGRDPGDWLICIEKGSGNVFLVNPFEMSEFFVCESFSEFLGLLRE